MDKCIVILAVVFAALCLTFTKASTELEKPCNDSRSTSLSFSIISRKNATGHWVAEVKMGPEITNGPHNGGWQIHVDQNTVDNTGLEPIVQIKATITAPAPVAGPGYELFPGLGYYKLHTEGKTWDEAKTSCELERGHLAIINSEAESDVIKTLFSRYPNLGGPGVSAFIGFHDKQTEGQYVTIFGEPLSSTGFSRWSTINAQPDDAPPGEDCGSVHRNGGLNDLGCDIKAPFFCEQDLYPASNVNGLSIGSTIDSGHGGEGLMDVRIGEAGGTGVVGIGGIDKTPKEDVAVTKTPDVTTVGVKPKEEGVVDTKVPDLTTLGVKPKEEGVVDTKVPDPTGTGDKPTEQSVVVAKVPEAAVAGEKPKEGEGDAKVEEVAGTGDKPKNGGVKGGNVNGDGATGDGKDDEANSDPDRIVFVDVNPE